MKPVACLNARQSAAAIVLAIIASWTQQASAAGQRGDLILNEFNCVGDTEFLEEDTPGDGNHDAFFGRVLGNGGNWAEFVVVKDHLDIRGWKLEWQNTDPDAGSVTFSNSAVWSNLRAGTIITVREDELGFGSLPSNTSFNPAAGDWWIHVNVDDIALVGQTGFKIDNDNWKLHILDNVGNVIQDYVGETGSGAPLWAGSGMNNQELGKLEQDPSAAAATTPPVPNYQDGNTSTFGVPNRWNNGANVQNFAALRAIGSQGSAVPALPALGVAALAALLAGASQRLRRRGR